MTEQQAAETLPARMPVIFAGHGSPMNAIEENVWSRGFASLREYTRRPRAILAISAHWYVEGTLLTADVNPATIHDFSGFPEPLYNVEYAAPGDMDLADRVRRLLEADSTALRTDWGLDHGSWSVLKWMYPEADVPVIQLSINRRLDVQRHFELAQSLAPLRDENVLVLASGNIVHNLPDAFTRKRAGSDKTPDWALRFDATVKRILTQRDTDALLSAWPDTDEGRQAHPTPDHWLPLIYAYAVTDDRDQTSFPIEGFDWGSISMRNVVFGQKDASPSFTRS